MKHWSDCASNNDGSLPKEECDCGSFLYTDEAKSVLEWLRVNHVRVGISDDANTDDWVIQRERIQKLESMIVPSPEIEEKRICPVSNVCPVSKSCTHSEEHFPEIYCDKFCGAEEGIPGIRCITINQPSVIEEMAEMILQNRLVVASELAQELATLARRGMVKLHPDQTPPELEWTQWEAKHAQQDMFNAGFRRIEE